MANRQGIERITRMDTPEKKPRKCTWSNARAMTVNGVVVILVASAVFFGLSALVDGLPTLAMRSRARTLLMVACCLPGGIFLLMGVIRWALRPHHESLLEQQRSIIAALHQISEYLSLSESAKQIMFRESDRKALAEAIETQIRQKNFGAALNLVQQMAEAFGSEADTEHFRTQVINARAEQTEQDIDRALAAFEELLSRHEWNDATRKANGIERQFPQSQRVEGLVQRVHETREQYIQHLERRLLDAKNREDVETADLVLKELDKYLTEKEAEPFKEAAIEIRTKKLKNLTDALRMSVEGHEWGEAVLVGEEIIANFSKSKAAKDVRSMLDMLRQRANEQSAGV